MRLIQIAGSKRWLLFISMLFALVTSLVQFVPFVAIYEILLELAGNAADPTLIDRGFIWQWGYIALWSFVALGVLNFVSLMFSHIAAFNILYELRMQLAKKMIKLPLGFFTKRASGEIKKIMSEDVERIELFVAHHIPDIVTAILFPVLLISYMFWVDWRLAMVMVMILVSAAVIMNLMYGSKKVREVTRKYIEVMGRMNGSIVEYVKAIQVVKTFTNSTKAYEKLNNDIREYRALSNQTSVEYMPTYVGFQLVLSSTLLFIIPVSVYFLVHSSSYSEYMPTALMFMIFGVGIFFPVLKLLWIGGFLSQNNMGVEKIDDILYMPEIEEPEQPLTPANSSIEFDKVSFAYNTTQVLKEVSFSAPAGSITALVGASGAGKSTVAMLAARFWDIAGGEIRIGGVPVKRIPTRELMNHISFVFQENILFFDTIEENIRMGNKAASFDEVVSAAKSAQCHEFIEKLPRGYKTPVGEGGTYLSGGQAQRVALARALLKDAPIVLLDEATAFTDPENEGKILEAFSNLIKGKTVLVIAHRLGTIVSADQILLFDKGVIAERGTHGDLLVQNGKYARMWEIYSRTADWKLNHKKGCSGA